MDAKQRELENLKITTKSCALVSMVYWTLQSIYFAFLMMISISGQFNSKIESYILTEVRLNKVNLLIFGVDDTLTDESTNRRLLTILTLESLIGFLVATIIVMLGKMHFVLAGWKDFEEDCKIWILVHLSISSISLLFWLFTGHACLLSTFALILNVAILLAVPVFYGRVRMEKAEAAKTEDRKVEEDKTFMDDFNVLVERGD